jgi:hypothetical protein
MKYKFQEKPTPKYIWSIIILFIFITVFGLLINQQYKSKPPSPSTTTTTSTTSATAVTPPKVTPGDLIIAVKDAPQKIPRYGTVTALNLTITKIEVHKAGVNDTNETSGWAVVFEGTRTLDLIQFTDVIAIVGQKELEPGKYTQIRLALSDSVIEIRNIYQNIYTPKPYPLKVPSEALKLIHQFDIQANKTTVLTLDFDLQGSAITKDSPEVFRINPTIKILEQTLDKGKKPENSTIIQ